MDEYWASEGFQVAAIIVGVLLFYYAFFYLTHSGMPVKYITNKSSETGNKLFVFFFRKLSGFLILGVLPAILYFGFLEASGDKFGVTFTHLKSSFIIIAGLIILTGFVLYFHHKRNPGKSTLQFNPAEWNISMFMLNALGWSLYLIAYEFLFRGILLFECYEAFGFWPALAINISIYSAIHMVSGKDQTIGALVFGAIACYFALSRGTLLIPVFMHLSLSLLSDYYSIRKKQRVVAAQNNKYNTIKK